MSNLSHVSRNQAITRMNEVQVYQNEFLTIFDDKVEFPSGHRGTYVRTVWRAPYSVGILPVTSEGHVVLIRQFCYARSEWTIQIPKGMGRADTAPQCVAQSELAQETGMSAGQWEFMKTVYVDPGFIANPTHLFRARDATLTGEQKLEPTEVIGELVVVRAHELCDNLWHERLTDLSTLSAIFLHLNS